jgi:hypothetical protein
MRELSVDLLELRPVVSGKLEADVRGLEPDVSTFHLDECVDPAPAYSSRNELSAQIFEFKKVFGQAD